MNWTVKNIINDKNNSANNQIIFQILDNNKLIEEEYFVSYGVKIIKNLVRKGEIYISSQWNYSKTTSKHIYIYFRDYTNFSVYSKKDIEDLIKDGKINLVDNID